MLHVIPMSILNICAPVVGFENINENMQIIGTIAKMKENKR